MLKIASNLSVPTDFVTQTPGYFGRKGSGKTYAAGKSVELMLSANIQVVVLDAVGNWYGLRLDKTGKHASRFTIPILGGEHGDVPLQPQAGAIVANFIVTTGSSAIIDVSRFRKHERKEFVTAFAEELFHRKKSNRSPMHFVLEEAQLFAPQRAFKGEERMLGALEDIVRLGRNYGIGSSLISQRPQSVNTELRNQCEPLVVFQLVAKHERDAIGDWMEHMGVDHDLESLAKLQPGECFFWSPAWLDKFVKTKFIEKESFDASATPKVGAAQYEPKKLAPVDLQALEASMKDTIEKAKADDPKELRKKIADLEGQLRHRPVSDKAQETLNEWKTQNAQLQHELKGLRKRFDDYQDGVADFLDGIVAANERFASCRARIARASDPMPGKAVDAELIPKRPETSRNVPSGNGTLPKGEYQILVAAVQHGAVGRDQLTVLTGKKRSTRDAYISRLIAKRYLWQRPDGMIEPTRQAALDFPNMEPLPTGAALRDYWLNELPEGESRVLHCVIAAYPKSVEREVISDKTGFKRSTRDAYLSRLKARRLIDDYAPGLVSATEILFQ